MNITVRQFRYFDAILRTGTIKGAAQDMRVSGSSITAALDLIKKTVGVPLFHRIPARGLVPTDAGSRVGVRVREFLAQTHLFETDLLSLAGQVKGGIKLACFEPTAPYVLPLLLRRITADYPDISIQISEGSMDKINEALLTGQVDLALVYRPHLTCQGVYFRKLMTPRPWILVPANWSISHNESLSLRELVNWPMIMLTVPDSEARIREIFLERKLRPNIVHSTHSGEVIRSMVAEKIGFSIMNIKGPLDHTGATRVIPLVENLPGTPFGLAWGTKVCSPVVRATISTAVALAQAGEFSALCINDDTV